jgi:hypothetical protein
MKVKELIKQLQDCDPEAHIRIATDDVAATPWFVEEKPGYWDGYYSYMEDGKLIFSTEGNKVDLRVVDVEDFIWDNHNNWEEMIDFRFTYADPSDKIERVKEKLREYEKEAKEYFNEA